MSGDDCPKCGEHCGCCVCDDPKTTASELTRLESELLASDAQVATALQLLNDANPGATCDTLEDAIAFALTAVKASGEAVKTLTERCAELEGALIKIKRSRAVRNSKNPVISEWIPQIVQAALHPAPVAENEERTP